MIGAENAASVGAPPASRAAAPVFAVGPRQITPSIRNQHKSLGGGSDPELHEILPGPVIGTRVDRELGGDIETAVFVSSAALGVIGVALQDVSSGRTVTAPFQPYFVRYRTEANGVAVEQLAEAVAGSGRGLRRRIAPLSLHIVPVNQLKFDTTALKKLERVSNGEQAEE